MIAPSELRSMSGANKCLAVPIGTHRILTQCFVVSGMLLLLVARFLKHIGCNRCGSSDANAVYEDGSEYCFSCRKPTSSKVSPYVEMYRRASLEESEMAFVQEKTLRLPSDASQNYSQRAVDWAAKYEITVSQLLKEGVVYSAQREQLIFTWRGAEGNLLAYQARNLTAVSKARRYFTCGDVNELLPIYHCRHSVPGTINNRRLVLVEDCLSAIKISYCEGLGFDSMPLLGSGISRTKLSRLRPFYDVLDVFLDPDMWHKSLNIVKQAQLLGFEACPVYADSDPKELAYSDLKVLLK